MPTLIGDTGGEYIWEGPLVAVMHLGSYFDVCQLMDINLTGYRDAIDYLGYFRSTIGSMIDGIGKEDHLAKIILKERCGKVRGVRINCLGDQGRGKPDLEPVEVPKTHPLFNLEGDDPFAIPEVLNKSWIAKAYAGKPKDGTDDVQNGLQNPLARLLLLKTSIKNGKWQGLHPWWHDPNIGSILVVNRQGGDLTVGQVRDMCSFIRREVYPLMTGELAMSPDGEEELLAEITEENFEPFDTS